MNPPMQSEEITLTASAKSQVVVGEQFRVVFTVNGEGKDFRGPDFKGFSMLSGPNTSNSFSTQIINGQISRSVSYSYTYYLLADQEGRFTVGSASISVNGNTYSSEPLVINVIKGQTQGKSAGSSQPKQSQPSAQSNPATISKEDIFLKVSVDNHNPWQGEQVILSYKIYTRRQISLPNAMVQPSLPGFWTEDLLKDEKQYKQTEEIISGSKYIVVEYKRIAAFPQKSGELTIPSFELEVAARVQSQRKTGDPFFDNFFGGSFFNSFQDIPVKIKSSPFTLKVRPLPVTGRPATFSGAVGQFTINGNADREALSTNDALTLRYNLSETGNIMMIESPQVVFPSDFEVYEPRITDNINASRSGVSGSRSFEYIAIPRAPGSFSIKSLTFSYFDPSTDRYKTISVPAMNITVTRAEGDQGTGSISSVSQEEVKFIGSDIRFIKTGDPLLRSVAAGFFLSTAFYLWFSLPVILFIIILLLYKQRLKSRSDR
ncbi:MAG: protein BatD, partial [Bacteroidales bacterium]|nr:protein BatD [Bacteroidales bacterium]